MSELRNYDAWLEGAFMHPAPAGSPYCDGPGKEDLLGQRAWLADEDAWATVEEAEDWEDCEADDEGRPRRYGGTDYVLKLDGSRRAVSMSEPDLEELLAKQSRPTYNDRCPCRSGRRRGECHA